jgi:hypothetical protein
MGKLIATVDPERGTEAAKDIGPWRHSPRIGFDLLRHSCAIAYQPQLIYLIAVRI